jgi:NifB/MoaA-like Fe-S oxidoreductase
VAIVPLGLTRYNSDDRLTKVTPEFCRSVIDQVTTIQADLSERLGTNFALLGDEIYLRAGRPIPARKHYGSYPQIEDGVGMVRAFSTEFSKHLSQLKREGVNKLARQKGTILTGTLFAPVLRNQIDKLNKQFGAALSARERISGKYVVIPKQMLKSDEAIMLDGMLLSDVEKSLGVPVHAVNLAELITLLVSPN